MANVIRSDWTTAEILQEGRHRGRPARVLAGSWVDDLSTIKSAIILCDACDHKWNPEKYGYRKRSVFPAHNYVQGQCDGCKQFKTSKLFLHEESLYFNRQWRLF